MLVFQRPWRFGEVASAIGRAMGLPGAEAVARSPARRGASRRRGRRSVGGERAAPSGVRRGGGQSRRWRRRLGGVRREQLRWPDLPYAARLAAVASRLAGLGWRPPRRAANGRSPGAAGAGGRPTHRASLGAAGTWRAPRKPHAAGRRATGAPARSPRGRTMTAAGGFSDGRCAPSCAACGRELDARSM